MLSQPRSKPRGTRTKDKAANLNGGQGNAEATLNPPETGFATVTNHAWKDGVKILEDFNPIWVSAFKELRAKTVGEVEKYLEDVGIDNRGNVASKCRRFLAYRMLSEPTDVKSIDTGIFEDIFAIWAARSATDPSVPHPLHWTQDLTAHVNDYYLRHEQINAAREIMARLDELLKPELRATTDTTKQWSPQSRQLWLDSVLEMIYDLRPAAERKTLKTKQMEEWVSQVLGYKLEYLDTQQTLKQARDSITKLEACLRLRQDPDDPCVLASRHQVSLWQPTFDTHPEFALVYLRNLFAKTTMARKIELMQEEKSRAAPSLPHSMSLADLLQGKTDINLLDQLDLMVAQKMHEKTVSEEVKNNARVNIPALVKLLPQSHTIAQGSYGGHERAAYIDQAEAVVKNKLPFVTEVGIRCDGPWKFGPRDEKSEQNWILAVPESAQRLQWTNPTEDLEDVDFESGRSLESILFSQNPDGSFFSSLYFSAEGQFFHINLQRRCLAVHSTRPSDPNQSKTEFECFCTFSYATKQIMQGSKSFDVVYLRLALSLDSTEDRRSVSALEELAEKSRNSDSRRLSETGSLLSEALQWNIRVKTTGKWPFNLGPDEITQPPVVMYRVSNFVRFSAALSHMKAPFKMAIEKLLGLVNTDNNDPTPTKEARAILYHLIMYEAPGKHVAVITEAHSDKLSDFLIQNLTIPVHSINVEQANYVSALRAIQKLTSQASLTFCFVRITNRLLALDLGRLIDTVHGTNVRLLIYDSASLLFTLRVVGKISAIYIPASLEKNSASSHLSVRNYPTCLKKLSSSALHHHYSTIFDLVAADGSAIIPDKHCKSFLRSQMKKFIEWREEERKWRTSSSSPFLIMIADESTESKIADYYLELPVAPGQKITRLNCREQSWQQIKTELNSAAVTVVTEKGAASNVVVFYKAQLLSDVHIRHIAASCDESRSRFVLVMPQMNPNQLSIRSAGSKILHGTSIRCISSFEEPSTPPQRSSGPNTPTKMASSSSLALSLSNLDQQMAFDAARKSWSPQRRASCLRAMYLIFGPLLTSVPEVQQNVHDSEWWRTTAARHMRSHEPSMPSERVIIDIHNAVCDVVNPDHKHETKSSKETLHYAVAHRIAVSVAKTVDNNVLDIPFFWFVQLDSMCQLLPQNLRVGRWLSFVTGDHSSMEIILSRKEEAKNVHSLHLPNFFFLRDETEKAIVEPSYRVVRSDPSMSEQELLLQSCIQGAELNWHNLERWTVFPHSTETLIALLYVYFQPLKLLSAIPLQSLFYAIESVVAAIPHNSSHSPANMVMRRLTEFVCLPSHEKTRELIISLGPRGRGTLSVLRWSCLRFLSRTRRGDPSDSDSFCDPKLFEIVMDQDDISLLIVNSVPLDIPREGSSTNKVVEILAGLDSDQDLISQQIPLREYFMQIPHVVASHLKTSDSKIGSMLLQFLLSPAMSLGREGLSKDPVFLVFARWAHPSPDRVERLVSSEKTGLSLRLTVDALALLLSRATEQSQVCPFGELILAWADRHAQGAAETLFSVIASAAKRNPMSTIIVSLMDLVMDEAFRKTKTHIPSALGEGPFPAVWDALATSSLDPIDRLLATKSNASGKIPLSHVKLLDLVVHSFTDVHLNFPHATDFRPLEQQMAWLSASESYILLNHILQQGLVEGRHALVFFNWLRNPHVTVPIFPSGGEIQVLRRMISLTGAAEEIARNPQQASNAALFLIAPFCVPYGIAQQFDPSQNTSLRQIVVAQDNNAKFLPFYLTSFARPLPKEIIAFLGEFDYKIDLADSLHILLLSYDVSRGVSTSLVELNLSALLNINQLNAGTETINAHSRAALAMVIAVWFNSMGVPLQELRKWKVFSAERIRNRLDAVLDLLSKSFTLEKTIQIPLPGVVDVTFRIPRSNIIMGSSNEDIDFTLKALSPLLGSELTVKKTIDIRAELVDDIKSATYQTLDSFTAQHFAAEVARRLKAVKLSQEVPFSVVSGSTHLIQAADSLATALKTMQDASSSSTASIETSVLGLFLFAFITSLNNQVDPHLRPASAFFYRAVFSRLGMTTDADAELVVFVTRKFLECSNLAVDCGSLSELISVKNYEIVAVSFEEHMEKAIVIRDPRSQADVQAASLSFLTEPFASAVDTGLPADVVRLFVRPSANAATVDDSRQEAPAVPAHSVVVDLFQTQSDVSAASPAESSGRFSALARFKTTQHSASNGMIPSDAIVDCRRLLEVQIQDGYAVLIVKPGLGGSLKCTKLESEKLFFEPHHEIETQHIIRAHFASNNDAWETINRQSRVGTILVLDGLLLKRKQSYQWAPILRHHVSYRAWDVLRLHEMTNFKIAPTVKAVLEYICNVVAFSSGFGPSDQFPKPGDPVLPEVLKKLGEENDESHRAPILLNEFQTFLQSVRSLANLPENASKSAAEIIRAVLKDNTVGRLSSIGDQSRIDELVSNLEELLCLCLQAAAFNQLCSIMLHLSILPSVRADLEGKIVEFNVNDETVVTSLKENLEVPDTDFPDHGDDAGHNLFPESARTRIIPQSDEIKLPTQNEVLTLSASEPVSSWLGFFPLKMSAHNNVYSPVTGRQLGYLISKDLLSKFTKIGPSVGINDLSRWLVDVLRSPLSALWKSWFIQMCSVDFVCLPPSFLHSASEGLMSQIISHCLARRCPVGSIQTRLCGAINLKLDAEPFTHRKNRQYGVYFCNSHSLRQLREAGIAVSVVDLAAFRDAPQDDQYLQIIAAIDGFTCFSYVRGLRKIDDLLLKWCCEFTERCPWAFIFFENCDSMFNFSENRDRSNYEFYNWPTVGELCLKSGQHNIDIYQTVFAPLVSSDINATVASLLGGERGPGKENDPSDDFNNFLATASALVEWQHEVDQFASSTKPFILFITSPPGAGKTFLLNSILNTRRGGNDPALKNCPDPIDCSNDELVERAMQDILTERLSVNSSSTAKPLLVADEFHMLTREQKIDLIAWSINHGLNQIVMIGNRSDDFDEELIDYIREHHKRYAAAHLRCRLGVQKLVDVLGSSDKVNPATCAQIEIWARACRSLFGEESLSLRTRASLVDIFEKHSSALEGPLAEYLLQKMPNLGEFACWNFAHEIRLVVHANADLEHRDEGGLRPMQLLVRTALLDTTGSLVSFPEFATKLKASTKYHPLIRLAAWIKLIHTRCNKKTPPLDSLFSLQVIDQVGFPLLLGLSGDRVPLQTALAFGTQGDYSDLEWLAAAIQHGYAINWVDVADAWRNTFITDIPKFKRVVSVCPSPSVCFAAVSEVNLCDIIEAADIAFAKEVIKYYDTRQDEVDQPNSPLFAAYWKILRHQLPSGKPENAFAIDAVVDSIVDHVSAIGVGPSVVPADRMLFYQIIVWASRFGYHKLSVPRDASLKTEAMVYLLQTVTSAIIADMKIAAAKKDVLHLLKSYMLRIWSGVFLPLLCTEGPARVHPFACLIIAESQFPAAWPTLISRLSRLVNGRAEQADLDALRHHEIFYMNPQNGDPASQFRFPPSIARGLLLMPALDLFWQTQLLQSTDIELMDSFCNAQTVRKLELGLRKLTKPLAGSWSKISPLAQEAGYISHLGAAISVAKVQSKSAQKKMQALEDKKMANLRRICKNAEILNYYNEYAGMSMDDIMKRASFLVKMAKDENNNPKGSEFDLGRDGAFKAFRILVGSFFRRTNEFSRTDFFNAKTRGGCGTSLQYQKGFHVEFVSSEKQFVELLDTGDFDQAWVISGDFLDWQMQVSDQALTVKDLQQFVDAVERFSATGRGLFLLAENDPYYFHANLILERLCDASLSGDFEGGKELHRGKHWAADGAAEDLTASLLMSGIEHLYEGYTICEPNPRGTLLSAAHNSNSAAQNPGCMLYAPRTESHGRICVDTGFTKLWMYWERAGTSRFYSNAAVWLLDLDSRLKENHAVRGDFSHPAKPRLPTRLTPLALPRTGLEVDIVICLDQSGSVGGGWGATVDFASELINSPHLKLATWAARVGVVPFTHQVHQFQPLSSSYEELRRFIRILRGQSANGGTSFTAAMTAANQLFATSNRQSSKVVIFETDGQDGMQPLYRRPAVDNIDTFIAIATSDAAHLVETPQGKRLFEETFRPDQVLSVHNFNQLGSLLEKIFTIITALAGKKGPL